MTISQEQQALVDKLRAKEPGMVQTAIDSLMGAGVTGGASKVVANAFAKFGQTAPSAAEAERIAAELAKASKGTSNKPLAKGLEGLKQSMQDTADRAAKAERVSPPTGQAAPLASTLEQLGVQAHVVAHVAKKPLAAAGTVAVGAGVAAVLPTLTKPEGKSASVVPTSLDPVKRQHEAFQAATQVDKASKPVLEHKPNQKQAKASAELNGVTDPTPYFSLMGKSLEPSDYTAVILDSQAGQTIYTLTQSGADKVFGKGKSKPVGFGVGHKRHLIPSDVFFNIPNDRIGQAATDANQVTITKADTPEQALQKASTLRDTVYREALQKRQQESTTLQDLRVLQERARRYAARGDIDAKKDLPKLDAQIAQEMENLDLRAQNDAKNNLDVINAHTAAVFSAKNAANKVSAADNLAKSVSDLTGLPADVTTMLAHSPIASKEMAKWATDRSVSGEPKLINTSGDIYNDLTVGRTRQLALSNKENPDVVNAELNIVKTVRVAAMEQFLKANPLSKKGEQTNPESPSFISMFRAKAQSTLISELLKQAKGIDFTESPQKDLEKLAKEGKTPEEIRNMLVNNLNQLELDTVLSNIGVTEPQLNNAIQAEIHKYFPPVGLFGIGQTPVRNDLVTTSSLFGG